MRPFLPFFFALSIVLAACTGLKQTSQSRYNEIFGAEAGFFRAARIGDDKKKIRTLFQQQSPLYDDLLGLTYIFPLTDGTVRAEFYSDLLSTSTESFPIRAIHLYLNLQDEIKTAETYDEIHKEFVKRYGLPDGAYGGWFWQNPANQMSIYLMLLPDKQRIKIQFIGEES